MKELVVCIDNKSYSYNLSRIYLTINKIYEVIRIVEGSDGRYYNIEDDNSVIIGFKKTRFITKNEFRKLKLSLLQ